MHTPVALLMFNRPDLTERVFEEIARARPRTLLVIADGPRRDKSRTPKSAPQPVRLLIVLIGSVTF